MDFKKSLTVFFLFLFSLPAFVQETDFFEISEGDQTNFFDKTDSNIENIFSEESPEENDKKDIPINKDILNNNNKELFPNIPNPFYEPDATVDYDEEPITFLGINARWLSDKLPNHEISHLFSLDFGYTLTGLSHNGWGIGLNYEQKIWRYFSLKTSLGTTTNLFSKQNIWCTSIQEDITFFCYPFGKGLEWLYVGCGFGADQLFYHGEGIEQNDYIFSFFPAIGWKQIFFKKFMIDINAGYRMVMYNTKNFEDNTDYIRTGVQIGIKFKIFWKRLLKSYIDNLIAKKTFKYKTDNNE